MKKFTILLVMISLFTGFTTAQIQMESFDLPTLRTNSKRPVFYTKRGTQNVIISMYNKESFVLKTPQLNSGYPLLFSKAGPLLIVKINGIEYELEDISKSNLDVNWISSISVFKDGSARSLYGDRAEDGAIIIKLKEKHGAKMIKLKDGRIVKFINKSEKVEPPFEIKNLK